MKKGWRELPPHHLYELISDVCLIKNGSAVHVTSKSEGTFVLKCDLLHRMVYVRRPETSRKKYSLGLCHQFFRVFRDPRSFLHRQ